MTTTQTETFVACPHSLIGAQNIVSMSREGGWVYDHRTGWCATHQADHAEVWHRYTECDDCADLGCWTQDIKGEACA